uniref:Uncharacterized protein n=1 Tax=Anguilla anguilla TaxID=7936 RepID=A0A0E9WBI6_ANGAN
MTNAAGQTGGMNPPPSLEPLFAHRHYCSLVTESCLVEINTTLMPDVHFKIFLWKLSVVEI